ncbi:MAG: fructosamine kinase family protein [Actinomycetaceae bacterium]|nr:fructosamine kinase family protein [Actinomycetaceae bacterium]
MRSESQKGQNLNDFRPRNACRVELYFRALFRHDEGMWKLPKPNAPQRPDDFAKTDPTNPDLLALEAASLLWLREGMVEGGALVVPLSDVAPGRIRTTRVHEGAVTADAAYAFGRALAVTHATGAKSWGCPPEGWQGTGHMGRMRLDLPPNFTGTWGQFFGEYRVLPCLKPARDNGSMSAGDTKIVERLVDKIVSGTFDSPQPGLVPAGKVARIHGDLWSGNVLWSQNRPEWAPATAGLGPLPDLPSEIVQKLERAARGEDNGHGESDHGDDDDFYHDGGGAARSARYAGGANVTYYEDGGGRPRNVPDFAPGPVGVLIDPAAQGGHAETDLAYLEVFGQPYLEQIYAGYASVSPFEPGIAQRRGIHQMHLLAVHAAIFGDHYGDATVSMALRYL